MAGPRVTLLVLGLVTLSAPVLLTGASKKKGFAVGPRFYRCGDLEVLNGSHWWYNWGSNFSAYTAQCTTRVPAGYVPMVWGWRKNGRSNDHDFGHYDTVLGFNEPNHRTQECSGCRVDYLATHYYGCNADYAMSYLKDLWNRFHRKIWLTEFSCAEAAPSLHLQYMRRILPRLEAAHFVYRYSWYTTRTAGDYGNGNLLKPNSSTLTQLGRFYMQF